RSPADQRQRVGVARKRVAGRTRARYVASVTSSPDAAPAAAPRPSTDVDRIADAFLDATVELSPTAATYMGIPGHDEDLDDYSPAGYAAHSELRRRTLAELAQATPVDDIDRVTVSAMRERLSLAEEKHT